MKFALLGAGRIGKVHARAISGDPDAELAIVYDPISKAAEAIAGHYSCAMAGIDEIAADPAIDAVAICTPTDLHAEQIERFARAGKAIFCEKPIDLSLNRVRQCLDVVDKTGAKLMIGFNRRFDPSFAALKSAIEAGEIGAVEMVNITSRDPAPPPVSYVLRSGGIFRDMTIHDFDMAQWLLGEPLVAVSAHGAALVDKEIGAAGDYDSVNVLLETASGKQAVVSNSRRATYGYDQRIEALGVKGMIAAKNQRPVEIERADSTGFHRPPIYDFFMSRYVAAFAAEIACFIRMVKEKTAPNPSGQDGLTALAIADAAVRSAAEGRKVTIAEVLAEADSTARSA